MKKLSILLMLLAFSMVFAATITTKYPVFAYESIGGEKTETVEGKITLDVVEVIHSYYKVQFTDGTDHVGDIGWIFRKKFEGNKIVSAGCRVREGWQYKTPHYVVKGGASFVIKDSSPVLCYLTEKGFIYAKHVDLE